MDTEWTRIRQLHADEADAAWQWFVERYQHLVRSLLAKRRPPALVDSATREFWSYLWQSRSVLRADAERSFRAYLFGILHRYSLAWLRDHQRLPQSSQDPTGLAFAPADDGADLSLWAGDCLRTGIQLLGQRFPQDALALSRYYGLPHDGEEVQLSVSAIAERMQKPISSVQQHLSRGRARLRQLLADELRRNVDSASAHAAEAALLSDLIKRRGPDLST
ncbi:MAG: RNA polymerase sigma factor [Planctomycetota bacterium]